MFAKGSKEPCVPQKSLGLPDYRSLVLEVQEETEKFRIGNVMTVRLSGCSSRMMKHSIDYLASRKSTQEAFRSRCHNLAKSSL